MKRDDAQTAIAPLSKPEAVRRAIEALGFRAEVSEILDYVREHFGISGDDEPGDLPVVSVVAPPAQPATARSPSADAAPRPTNQRKPRQRPAPDGE